VVEVLLLRNAVWKVVIVRINLETVGRMMHHRTAVFQH